MEALSQSLNKIMESNKLQLESSQTIESIIHHPSLVQWFEENPSWQKEELEQYIIKLYQYVQEQDNCSACQGLAHCGNLMKGYYTELMTYGDMLELAYSSCRYLQRFQQEESRRKLIRSHHIPKDIMSGTLGGFDKGDDRRIDAFTAVMDFCIHAEPGQSANGLYLYGSLGVGKSYLLGAACNKLAERDIATYMVYSPDFFREMKDAITDHTVQEKLWALKEIPVLIFDDIGAENITPWARDEILGAILQYRIMEKLPTLYSSNYSYEQLEEHLAYSQKGGIEQLKAKRIMERIRHYTDAYFMNGDNRRKRR